MGCTMPCCDEYEELPEDEMEIIKPEEHSLIDVQTPVKTSEAAILDLGDLNSPVFKGTSALQKFSNKSTYDQKFMWINIQTRTLNLSEYNSKDKRHKEASIGDIVNVVAGPPEKFKASVDENGVVEKLSIGQCLSVTFVRGGGIDIKFLSEAERDAWYLALTKLMAYHRASLKAKPTVGMSQYD